MFTNCYPYYYKAASCSDCRDGDVHLVGGSYQWEGRVEVYMSGVWGTITDSEWTDNDARVVCRKLGYRRLGICIATKLAIANNQLQ